MCRLFDPSCPGQCDHDRTDPPVIKESANFCEYFKPSPNSFAGDTLKKQENARSTLDSLFGDGEPEQDESGLSSSLDDLFED